MDVSVVKAGVVMAAGLLLLVPTFNALNQSYVQNVPPPPWLPTDVTPPDITPPTDMTPPTDFKPPTNYHGKVPPVCPPPVIRYLPQFNGSMQPSSGYTNTFPLHVPNSTAILAGYVNFTQWQASQISASLTRPDGTRAWSNSTAGAAGLFAQPTPVDSSYFYNSTEDRTRPPAQGDWTLTMSAQFPIQGAIHAEFAVVLPCGGLASK